MTDRPKSRARDKNHKSIQRLTLPQTIKTTTVFSLCVTLHIDPHRPSTGLDIALRAVMDIIFQISKLLQLLRMGTNALANVPQTATNFVRRLREVTDEVVNLIGHEDHACHAQRARVCLQHANQLLPDHAANPDIEPNADESEVYESDTSGSPSPAPSPPPSYNELYAIGGEQPAPPHTVNDVD